MRIFIASSDATIALLPGCLHQIQKHWPDHPDAVIAGYTPPTFTLPEWAEFHSIGNFSDYPVSEWSTGIIRALDWFTDPVFIWHMEDFWPIAPIDGVIVKALYDLISLGTMNYSRADLTDDRSKSGHAVDLGTWYKDGHLISLVETPPKTPYQLSFQTCVFRRDELLKYLVPHETPAQAEIRGAHRMSQAGAKVIGTHEAPFKYLITMQHGKMHLRDSGYQDAASVLTPDDLAELEQLGLLPE